MRHPPRLRSAAALAALSALAATPAERSYDRETPLAVLGGKCTFVLPAGGPGTKFLLIVGSLSRGSLPYSVTVHTEPTADAVTLPRTDDDPGPAWRRRVDDLADRLEQARNVRPPAADYPPAADPPRHHDFFVFTGGSGFSDPTSYSPVRGDLRGTGRRCLVYLDHDYADPHALQPVVDEVIRVFDGEVYPAARAGAGRCLDVDRDGRFTVLLSPRLSGLTRGKGTLSGFVRGSDFHRELRPPYGNRCDMLYLSTDLRPGPYLRTLVAHEYAHAVVYSEHVFGDYLPEERRVDEESWLNEGLAHLAEERHGFGWGNLDYRVSAFLAAPRRYPLVVPDYYGAGLWRDPGCRGATYLFLHACACEHAGLAGKLTRSSLCGVDNLEAATREPFAALFRRWTIAVARGAFPGGHDLNRPLGGRLLCGPRCEDVPLSGGRWESDVAATSAAYLLLHSPAGPRSRVTVEADAGADLQVTLVSLPSDLPRLTLRAELVRPGAYRLAVTAHDAAVTLEEAVWEKAAPAGEPGDTSCRPDGAPGAALRTWFGKPDLPAGVTRLSGVIELPAGDAGPCWFKVTARDGAGRPVAAWAQVRRGSGDTGSD